MPDSSLTSPLVDPDAVAKRLLQAAHNRDGLPEIAIGLIFLLVSGLTCAQVRLPRESVGFQAAVLAFSFLIPLLCFGSPWALKWVRSRYLIERWGYMQSQPIGRNQIGIAILVAVLIATALFAFVSRNAQPDRWLLAGTGLFGGALGAWCGRLPRFAIGGLLMAATGIWLAFSGVSPQMGFAILFGFQGLLALISGAVVFLRFLREPVEPGQ